MRVVFKYNYDVAHWPIAPNAQLATARHTGTQDDSSKLAETPP